MRKVVVTCDCYGCCWDSYDDNYDPSLDIGGFMRKMEIQIRTSYFRCGVSGISRWADVDLCKKCKEKALVFASRIWVATPSKRNAHYE